MYDGRIRCLPEYIKNGVHWEEHCPESDAQHVLVVAVDGGVEFEVGSDSQVFHHLPTYEDDYADTARQLRLLQQCDWIRSGYTALCEAVLHATLLPLYNYPLWPGLLF